MRMTCRSHVWLSPKESAGNNKGDRIDWRLTFNHQYLKRLGGVDESAEKVNLARGTMCNGQRDKGTNTSMEAHYSHLESNEYVFAG